MNNFFQILKSANNSSEALNKLYLFNKEKNKKFSLGYLCQQSSIPSKGYLGDVFKGRRILNRKYNSNILEMFNLGDKEKRILELLLMIDQEKNTTTKESLRNKLLNVIKSYNVKSVDLDSNTKSHLIAIIFSTFSLLKHKKLENFCEFLPHFSHEEIKEALKTLIDMKMCTLIDEEYSLLETDVICNNTTEPDINASLNFLNSAINFAKEKLPKNFSDSEHSYFQSTVLSIKKDELPKFIKKLKIQTDENIADMEKSIGDELLHINIQVFSGK